MLGKPDQPSLLVTVDDNYNPADFAFDVINGAWLGHFTNGHVSVLGGTGYCPPPWSSLDRIEILTDNQDRLTGGYQEVFNNWDNPDYVAKKANFVAPASWDDDIAF